jgi:hypothetical protein
MKKEKESSMFYVVLRDIKQGSIFYTSIESLEGAYDAFKRKGGLEVLSLHDDEERAKQAQREAILERYY